MVPYKGTQPLIHLLATSKPLYHSTFLSGTPQIHIDRYIFWVSLLEGKLHEHKLCFVSSCVYILRS